MRRSFVICSLALTLALVLGGGVARATQCNIDLTNTGSTTAYGVTITLPGIQSINPTTGIYSGGGGDDVFHTFSITIVGGNTVLTWTNPTTPYNTSSTVQGHVGFTPSSGDCDIVAFNFLNQSGSPLPGAGLPYVEVHWVGSSELVLFNNFSYPVTVTVYGTQVSTALTLPQLNRFNTSLMSSLQPLTGGGSGMAVQGGGANRETETTGARLPGEGAVLDGPTPVVMDPNTYYHWHWPWPPVCPACMNVAYIMEVSPDFSEVIGSAHLFMGAP
jgi:hypothetical protein